MDQVEKLRRETRTVVATGVCFVVGAILGALVLGGVPRPLAGAGSLGLPAALIAGAVSAAAFLVSTITNRRGETRAMPRWQTIVSDLASTAVTVAFGAVSVLGVLLAGQVLAQGLQGLEVAAIGGGLFTGAVSAVGGRFAYSAGIDLRTRDLAGLVFGFLIIGTLFAMLTATEPRWWENNFSQLGLGEGGWAFNGTLVVAGFLMATVGSYIGRDLHRLLGDGALPRITVAVSLWAAAGIALALVGAVPVEPMTVLHVIAAVASLALFLAAASVTAWILPGPPRALSLTTWGLGVLLVGSVILWMPMRILSGAALEAIAVGLALLWMTTLVRVLGALAPAASRPSSRRALLHA
ncbi:hypothetical protein J2Y69_001732 [Microbacterium resistens]|uniref:DUF998 domain-containing protein n=1 Tax=Microbacterium resistens TaxID=156977 RepID=A0ABU1SC10_9MICO|nr:DUF998 domain-containing protein [Microbacterium resistens]MDR6867133.1 hypothetical protein [Microbacterium resistens]